MTENDRRTRGTREPLMLKVEYPEAGDLLADYTENISRGGTFILTRRDLAVGTPVRIELSFPGLLAPIVLDGEVRWARSSMDPDQRGLGVAFQLEEGDTAARLAQIVECIERGDPEVIARTLRVLVVEDNPHVGKLLEEGLGMHAGRDFQGRVRFEFEHCKDGRQALELLRTQGFDLAIIDIYLPIMDGATLIRALRADPRLGSLPIIAVSAGGRSAHELAQGAGADFFVEKPMRLQEILRTVKKLVEL
ncbi:MAG TPA: TIGR02266 family protein [Polyangia bacterium]|nr:TIGR02266 family protein [Polyangia bacterium]